MRLAALFLLASVLGLHFGSAHAQIYKWVDENGKTVYSQSPPPKGTASRIKTRRSPISDEAARERLKSLREKADNRLKNRELAATEDKEAGALAERRKKNCAQARANLKVLQESARVRVKDADGNPVYLDEASKQKKMSQTRAQIEEFCS